MAQWFGYAVGWVPFPGMGCPIIKIAVVGFSICAFVCIPAFESLVFIGTGTKQYNEGDNI
jgi:hypothetical protein